MKYKLGFKKISNRKKGCIEPREKEEEEEDDFPTLESPLVTRTFPSLQSQGEP